MTSTTSTRSSTPPPAPAGTLPWMAAPWHVRFPVVQAPMAGVSTPALAAAVCRAGALGSIMIGTGTVAQAGQQIGELRSLGARAFNVNLFCHAPAVADAAREAAWLGFLRPVFASLGVQPPATLVLPYRSFVEMPDMLGLLLHERPAVVSFHFGLPPAAWIARLREAGCITLACATTPHEAAAAGQAGVDAIVAQGIEAGGHRGVFDPAAGDAGLGTLALVRLVVAQTRLPVLAAGGIMDGAGIRAAMALGAAGVQMGTAFIGCPESSAPAAHRAALTGPRGADTRVTAAISGRPARGLPNRAFTALLAPDAPPLPDYPIAYDAGKALAAAAAACGSDEFAVQWAGQGAPLARPMPAADLVATLAREAGWT